MLALLRENVVSDIDAASVLAAANAASASSAGAPPHVPLSGAALAMLAPSVTYPASASAAAGGSLPPNSLAHLVGSNLQEWMHDDDAGDVEEEEEEEDVTMAEDTAAAAAGADESKRTEASTDAAAASVSPRRVAPLTSATSSASAASAGAGSAAAASSPAQATPAPKGKGGKKRAASAAALMLDDTAEMEEIMGSGHGAGVQANRRRGLSALMRRGNRIGVLSRLPPDLERRMGEANSAYISNDFARAVDILLHIIQAAPHALGPYQTLGLIYEERGELVRAVEAFMLAAHMSRRDWALWKRVARMAADSGQLEQAVYCWNKVLLSETDNVQVRLDRALALFDLKEYKKALDGFMLLLKKSPNDPTLLRHAAACYAHMYRPQSGVALLRRYVEWFRQVVRANAERDRTHPGIRDKLRAQRRRIDAGTAPVADANSADPVAAISLVTGNIEPALLRGSDIDVNLINILCELTLTLHRAPDVVDLLEELMPMLKAAMRRTEAGGDPELLKEAERLEDEEDAAALVAAAAAAEDGGDVTAAPSSSSSSLPPASFASCLPMDLHSKLGVAYINLGELTLADSIFEPLLAQGGDAAQTYDVETWGDLYFEVAEAYMRNKGFTQAETLCEKLLQVPEWQVGGVYLLQAKCAHGRAVDLMEQQQQQQCAASAGSSSAAAAGAGAGTSVSSADVDAQVQQLLLRATSLFERVHEDEGGENADVRMSLSELYHVMGHTEKAIAILKGVDVEAQQVAAAFTEGSGVGGAGAGAGGAKGGARGDAALNRFRAAPQSASLLRAKDDLRIFAQSCELLLSSGNFTAFFQAALPVITNILTVATLDTEEDEEYMPHETKMPSATRAGGEAAAAAGGDESKESGSNITLAPPPPSMSRFLELPVDPSHSFNAQRLLLSFEFLRPAFACVQQLYAQDRLSESLWLITKLDRVLVRFTHSSAFATASNSRAAVAARSNPTYLLALHVRELLLGLKYVSACIFLRLGDAERAYRSIRLPLVAHPRSWPLAHLTNLILNTQAYPHKALKLLERLYNKHPTVLPLQLMLGHTCLVHHNYEVALKLYAQLWRVLPTRPLLPLLIGVARIQVALKKTNQQRHHDLLAAFACMQQYKRLRQAEAEEGAKKAAMGGHRHSMPPHHRVSQAEQESTYNIARAFHNVGLGYMARPLYEHVLALASRIPVSDVVGSLHAEAAHNLAILYSQTGSPELARTLYAQYCRV